MCDQVVRAQYSCLAAPAVYSPWCNATQGLFGNPTTTVKYTIEALQDTSIFCKGLGIGSYPSSCLHNFGAVDLGIFNDQVSEVEVYWGNNAGNPGISCMSASPIPTAIKWSYAVDSKPYPGVLQSQVFKNGPSCSGAFDTYSANTTNACTCDKKQWWGGPICVKDISCWDDFALLTSCMPSSDCQTNCVPYKLSFGCQSFAPVSVSCRPLNC